GIPGTAGGAAYMNAGAIGQETADTIDCVEIFTTEGEHGHHCCNIPTRVLGISKKTEARILEKLTFLEIRVLSRRKFTQPVGERSAGSVFRNLSAAEFIERAGLKGYRIGGAMVSKKHANFFINCGGATSQEMLELIKLVKETVFERFGVELKEEIFYVHPFCKDKNPNRDSKTSFEK
ncbi:UDP-N-acetylenolpyruvoylglucosamine reductase-like isoform X1, partial [Olea europaea subsp. europaea]